MANNYNIKIGTVELNLDGDVDYIEKERAFFFEKILPLAVESANYTRNIQNNSPILETNFSEIPRISSTILPALSINEFLKSKCLSSNNDIAMALIYYNEKYNNIKEFSSEDLKSCFLNAKIKLPSNVSDVVNQLVKKGHIQSVKNSSSSIKLYSMTMTGEEYIENLQPKEDIKNKTSSKSRKPRTKSLSKYDSLTREALCIDKYPPLKTFKDFKDKMMAALYIVTAEGKGEYFTTADVQCILTDILGEKSTKDQVNGVFRRETNWFNEMSDAQNKKTILRKLLNPGIDYAKKLLEQPTI